MKIKSLDKTLADVEDTEEEITMPKRVIELPPQGLESFSIILPNGTEISLNSVVYDVKELKKLCFDALGELNKPQDKNKNRDYYG